MDKKMIEMLENELLDLEFQRLHALQNRNLAWIDLMNDIADANADAVYRKSLQMEFDFWNAKTFELEDKAMAIAGKLGGR